MSFIAALSNWWAIGGGESEIVEGGQLFISTHSPRGPGEEYAAIRAVPELTIRISVFDSHHWA